MQERALNIESEQGSPEQITARENKLRIAGYRLTDKSNEKDLLPGEYFKCEFSGSQSSPIGKQGARITWCPLP
jgi:hypothetical protein